jgi:RHS repeat-associated protein
MKESVKKERFFSGDLDYYPFGMEMPGRSLNPSDYRFAYQGLYAEADAETGLSSFWLRNYDARIGQFTTTDPFGQGFSSYSGMGNNPVSLVDPTGGITTYARSWADGMAQEFVNTMSKLINASYYEGNYALGFTLGGGSCGRGFGNGGGGVVFGNPFAGNQNLLDGQSMAEYTGLDPLYALVIAGLISEEGYVEAGPIGLLCMGDYGQGFAANPVSGYCFEVIVVDEILELVFTRALVYDAIYFDSELQQHNGPAFKNWSRTIDGITKKYKTIFRSYDGEKNGYQIIKSQLDKNVFELNTLYPLDADRLYFRWKSLWGPNTQWQYYSTPKKHPNTNSEIVWF